MVYKILLVLVVALETALVPVFLKEQKIKKTNKSLAVKMVCATLFLLVGVFAIQISGNRSEFVKLLIMALSLGWIGDLFLHLRGGAKTYGVGAVAFFAGHLLYAYTYIKLCFRLEPDWSFFVPWRIVTLAVLVAGTVAVIAMNYNRLEKWVVLPCVLYATMLATMAICAVSVSILFTNEGNLAFAILLSTGSILFAISDATIGILDFGKVKSYPLKCVNIATYFAGQTAIAASLAFLNI
ncbi:MAG: hypothetical protein EOM05_00580 [Clostridia bacterium]|nr:hypothetical protein [Clostridia bacterium]